MRLTASTQGLAPHAEYTLACRDHNFVQWHLGRRFYAVWIIETDTPEIRAQISALRSQLGEWLLPDYRRQPHITVAVCGFPQIHATDAHSYTEADFQRDLACLQAASAPLRVSTGPAGSFTTAAYLGITGDMEALHAMRSRMRVAETQAYVPHITAGFYSQQVAMSDVQQQLGALSLPQTSLVIKEITLAVYASAKIAGPLFPVCRYQMEQGHLQMLQARYLPWPTRDSA